MQLLKIREREEEVKNAIETAELLVGLQSGQNSARQLKQFEKLSNRSNIPGGTTDHTSAVGSNIHSSKHMPPNLTGTFSSSPHIETQQVTEHNDD